MRRTAHACLVGKRLSFGCEGLPPVGSGLRLVVSSTTSDWRPCVLGRETGRGDRQRSVEVIVSNGLVQFTEGDHMISKNPINVANPLGAKAPESSI